MSKVTFNWKIKDVTEPIKERIQFSIENEVSKLSLKNTSAEISSDDKPGLSCICKIIEHDGTVRKYSADLSQGIVLLSSINED